MGTNYGKILPTKIRRQPDLRARESTQNLENSKHYCPDNVDFKTIIWRNEKVTPVKNLTPVVAVALNRFEQIVLALSNGAMGCVDLAQQLGIVETKNLRRRYARVLLDDGIIEFTIPEKPNSRLQKYRLTAKGQRLAAGLRANGGMSVKGEST